MKGLLLKDIYNMKSFGVTTLAIVALYAVISLISGNVSMLTSLLLVFCAMLPMSSTSIDEQAKWGAYAQCMPISRKMIVDAKYLFILLILVAAAALAFAVTAISSLWAPIVWGEVLLSNAIILCMVLIANTVTVPVTYKVGAEKARLITIVVFLLLMLPVLLLMGNVESFNGLPSSILVLVPIVAVVLFTLSYFISVRIYQEKEL